VGENVKLITIVLDRPRTLRNDFNAWAAFEGETHKNMLALPPQLNATDLRALLWALLLHEDKSLTIEQVGAMLTPFNLKEVMVAITAARTENEPPAPAAAPAVEGEPLPPAASL
jgi:hypothetical protein